MKLSDIQKKVKKLNVMVNKEYKGKFFSIPTSILESNNSSYVSVCRVLKIDLHDGMVELSYEADGEDELWTAIRITDFEKYSIAE